MKKLVLCSALLAAAAFIVAHAAGWTRDRYAIEDVEGVLVLEGGQVLVGKTAPFGLGAFTATFNDHAVTYVEHTEYGDDRFRTGWHGMRVEVEEGDWLDCLIGRCGRIVVRNYFSTSVDRPDGHPRPLREPGVVRSFYP